MDDPQTFAEVEAAWRVLERLRYAAPVPADDRAALAKAANVLADLVHEMEITGTGVL
jgi:hypothetical protein